LLFAAVYFLLILPYFLLFPSGEKAKEEYFQTPMGKVAFSMIWLSWFGSICHSVWVRKTVNLRIKYAALESHKADGELARKIAAEYAKGQSGRDSGQRGRELS